MLRKSFKLLSQKVFIPFLVLSFLVVGCSNGSDDGDGKNISATQGDNGIEVTVQAPEGCSVIYFIRSEPGSTLEDYWYCTENASAGANTATDYFTEANKTYIYYAQFYDADWNKLNKSDSVEINSSVKGLDSPVVTNVPKATYNSGTRKFKFTTKPTFSYTQSKVGGYPNLVIDLLFKTADETYDTICTYRLGDDSTGEVHDWVFNKHLGKTMEFVNFKFKLKSADYKTSYEWDVGRGADIPAITLDDFARLSTTTVEDFLGKTISTDRDMTADPSYTIEFQDSKTDGKVYSDKVWYHDDITVVIMPPANSSNTCLATLTKNNGTTKDWDNYPVYLLTFGNETRVFVESMTLSKTTTTTGLQGVYLVGDENDYIKYTLGNNGAVSFSYKHDDDSDTITGTYTCNQGIIEIDLGTAGKQYLVYKSNGNAAIGEYFYLCG
ncbi:hypothetical protein [Treponema bryantii]|uniref:hypothetical protein n=1 Tax=Treponema bryantii TaxID=163 RepID=UPI0003B38497|nr:hypothetical protein [Treponema bryantii]